MPPLEERVQYPYMNIRTKAYPWGDGDKVSLFDLFQTYDIKLTRTMEFADFIVRSLLIASSYPLKPSPKDKSFWEICRGCVFKPYLMSADTWERMRHVRTYEGEQMLMILFQLESKGQLPQ